MPQQFTFNLINNTGLQLHQTALVGLPGSMGPAAIAVHGVAVATVTVPDGVGGIPGVGLLRYGSAAGDDWRITMAVPPAGGGAPNAAGLYFGAAGHGIALAAAGPPFVYNVTYS
jgi:hypothetical protein